MASLAIVAAAVVAGGQVQQGMAAKEEGKAMRKIAEYNAQVLEQQAVAAEQRAGYAATLQEREGRRLTARQRALYAKGGVMVDEGTSLTVLTETARELEMERLMVLREGKVAAGQARSRAYGEQLRGKAAERRGKAAFRGSLLSAGGTILTGIQ